MHIRYLYRKNSEDCINLFVFEKSLTFIMVAIKDTLKCCDCLHNSIKAFLSFMHFIHFEMDVGFLDN